MYTVLVRRKVRCAVEQGRGVPGEGQRADE